LIYFQHTHNSRSYNSYPQSSALKIFIKKEQSSKSFILDLGLY